MRTRIALVFGSVIMVFLSFLSAAGQQSIGDKKITIHLERAAFGKVIEVLIEKYDVAVSFEQSLGLSANDAMIDFDFEPNVRYELQTEKGVLVMPEREYYPKKYWFCVNFDEAKLSEVMDSIVAQMPDYRWEINDGVINIFPAKNRDDLFRELLAVRIAKFDVDKPYIIQIENEIMEMPELTKFVNDNGLCTIDLSVQSDIFNSRKLPDEIHFSDMTIKELLNRITKIKRGGWILRRYRYSNGNEFINIQT